MIEKIDNIINWYHANYKSATGGQLANAKSNLLGYLYTFTEEVADRKHDSNNAYIYRRYNQNKLKSKYISEKMSISLAESKSLQESYKEMKEESMTEHLAYLMKLKLTQANKIVEDITQRISTMNKELKY